MFSFQVDLLQTKKYKGNQMACWKPMEEVIVSDSSITSDKPELMSWKTKLETGRPSN